jgi:mono/diheme cytochrome c family protein
MKTRHAGARRCLAVLAALLLAGLAPALQAQPRSGPPPGDYRLVDGKVDSGTFTGWRLFHTACFGCHGVDAVGTDVAPNLLDRVRTMTPRAFATKVLTSYRIAVPSAEAGAGADREALLAEVMRQERGARGQIVMPAWESNPVVNPHVLDLFAYLTARADGKLAPGRPVLIGTRRGAAAAAR